MSKPEVSAISAALISRYREGAGADLNRQRRLGVQYAIGSGMIAVAAVVLNLAWLSLLVWAVFVAWLALRQRAGAIHAEMVAQAFAELESANEMRT
jgi:hypothetical protein